MKYIQSFESLNEAKKSTIHRAAKKGSYPAVIVVVQDGKVIHQEPVSTPDIAPATFNVMQEKYPKALLHLEDNTGKRLFSESVVTEGETLKKGDIVKFKDGSSIYIVGPKGDGYDYKDGRELGHHPKGWFDMMISTGKAVIESVVTEAAKIETERYVRSHGKKPTGYGGWMFSYNRDGSDVWQIPNGMSWPDAQNWAKKKAKEDGEDYVYVMENESVNEAKFTKRSLMKAMKKDDGMIQLSNGQEYVIYNPNNGNDDNADMWKDKVIFGLDQDGEEHEIEYSDIVRYDESVVNEAMDINDPVLMAFRATRAIMELPKFKPAEVKSRRISFDKYMDLLDSQTDIGQDIKDKAEAMAQTLRDMEQEAEPDGGVMADKYGSIMMKQEKEYTQLKAKKAKIDASVEKYRMS